MSISNHLFIIIHGSLAIPAVQNTTLLSVSGTYLHPSFKFQFQMIEPHSGMVKTTKASSLHIHTGSLYQ